MMKGLLAAAFAAGFAFAIQPHNARAEDTKLAVIVFPGVQNLPMFAAQAKGFYAKRGLSVDLKFTPNSNELRNGLAEGRYQIAHSAIDNAFALKDKANVDIAVVIGGAIALPAELKLAASNLGVRRQQLEPSDGAARYQVARRYQGQDGGSRCD